LIPDRCFIASGAESIGKQKKLIESIAVSVITAHYSFLSNKLTKQFKAHPREDIASLHYAPKGSNRPYLS
jgi:hypothetical protein